MAKQNLPTNYQDDIMNASMNGKRRYNLITNADGTYSLEDATVYDQVGSEFGSGNVNAICKAVNESADKNKIIESLDDVEANTKAGMIAGAMALKEVSSNLKGFEPIVDSTGKITGYKTEAGADTVFPFISGLKLPYTIQDFGSSVDINSSNTVKGFEVSENIYDLSEASSLTCTIRQFVSQTYSVTMGVSKVRPTTADEILSLPIKVSASGTGIKNLKLDVSSIDGEYYISIAASYNTSGLYAVNVSRLTIE